MIPNVKNNVGLTLIELMIVLAIFSILSISIFRSYNDSMSAFSKQNNLVSLQDNMRGIALYIEDQIMKAGYEHFDPATLQFLDSGAQIIDATDNSIHFTCDINEDGEISGAGEEITIGFFSSQDSDMDGIVDNGTKTTLYITALDDNNTLVDAVLAEDIRAIAFAYAYDNDNDGSLDVSTNGHILWAVERDFSDNSTDLDWYLDADDNGVLDGGVQIPLEDRIPTNNIQAVQVWILGRSKGVVRGYTDGKQYTIADRVVPGTNDSHMYLMLHKLIKCRNQMPL